MELQDLIAIVNEAFAPEDVISSHLETVAYTDKLYIKFYNGKIYEYDDVPEDLAYEMLSQPSKGVYFWKHIRGKYPYRIVPDMPTYSAPIGYKFRAPDGDIYKWRGAMWVNTRTGRVATRAVRDKITQVVQKMERYKNEPKDGE